MPFIKKLGVDFEIKDGRIILSPEYIKSNSWKFKKATATRFGSLCEKSKYSSPVKVWCDLVGIYKDEINPIITDAGNAIEPKIRELANKVLSKEFNSNIRFDYYDSKKNNFDMWKDSEPVVGGIPDGECLAENGVDHIFDENHPILEIKTSSINKFQYVKQKGVLVLQIDESTGLPKEKLNGEGQKRQEWFDKETGNIIIPESYQYQLGLYLYLRAKENNRLDKPAMGVFAVCFLKTEDYLNPKEVDINQREIKFVKFIINPRDFAKNVEYVTNWYNQYVKGGYSPKLTANDEIWLKEVEYK